MIVPRLDVVPSVLGCASPAAVDFERAGGSVPAAHTDKLRAGFERRYGRLRADSQRLARPPTLEVARTQS